MNETARDIEGELKQWVASCVFDPLKFVVEGFDWGHGDLKGETGPDDWQTEILLEIGKGSLTIEEALLIAVRSGHGIGKTALIAWIILWFMATRTDPQVVVTANTSVQLETKTWREVAKWHKRLIIGHWFIWRAKRYYRVGNRATWFAAPIPWNKDRSEAFAGTHERHVLIIYDEASLIDDIIWEVTEGAMTTPGAMWVVFGNPTKNTGRFSQCFKKYRHRWITREIDSRTAKKANQKQIQQWIEDYGEDSDFVRVRVKGKEPRAGSMQLIGEELVSKASGRIYHPSAFNHAPKVIGVDVARFGDDQSALIRRQGLVAFGLKKWRNIDTMKLASLVAQEINEWDPDAVFVDVVGIGAGVYDRLVQLKYGKRVIPVSSGETAIKEHKYFNRRIEMWDGMAEWLKAGGAIPADTDLMADLVGPEYGYDAKERKQLERKKDMKARGVMKTPTT